METSYNYSFAGMINGKWPDHLMEESTRVGTFDTILLSSVTVLLIIYTNQTRDHTQTHTTENESVHFQLIFLISVRVFCGQKQILCYSRFSFFRFQISFFIFSQTCKITTHAT